MAKYDKASDLLVIDLINLTNTDADTGVSIDIKPGELLFGNPVVHTPAEAPEDYNTDLKCTATKESPYLGSVTVGYDRLDLQKLFKNIAVNLDVGSPKTTADLLPLLNRKYGLGIAAEEVAANPVDTTGATPWHHTIVMVDTCLTYIGTLDVTVGPDADVGEDLNLVITKTRLDGIHYPVDGTDKGQAYIYSFGVDCNAIRPWLATLAKDVPIDDTALAKELNKIVPERWHAGDAVADYNVRGAKVTYTGPTADLPDANRTYNTVVTIVLAEDKCANFAGELFLHYNS